MLPKDAARTSGMFSCLRILVIPKHLPLTINKYNNTAVSAAITVDQQPMDLQQLLMVVSYHPSTPTEACLVVDQRLETLMS